MSNIYGYCRISTSTQSLDRQERNIKEKYGDAIVLREVCTGRTLERPVWNKLYSKLKAGDTVVFDEVSRMSRDAENGFTLYQELYDRGIELVFLKEPHISTTIYRKTQMESIDMTGNAIADEYIKATNKVLMMLAEKQIKLAFEASQHEVDFLRQRTKEGIETARLCGKQIGCKTGATFTVKNKQPIKDLILKKSKTFEGQNSDSEVIAIINSTKYNDVQGMEKTYHISNNTYYKYKKELKYSMTE